MKNNVSLDDIFVGRKIWVASTGTLCRSCGVLSWKHFIVPQQTKIKSVKIMCGATSYITETVDIYTDIVDLCFHYHLNSDNFLNMRYDYFVGLKEEDIFEMWFGQLKSILKDSWSGINEKKSNNILKKYIFDNEFDFFNKNYPELLF